MKKFKLFSKTEIIIIAVIVLLIIGWKSCAYTTSPNEFSVILEFGKVEYINTDSGLAFHAPFIQSVVKVDRCLMFYDIPQSDVITSDKKTMIADCYVTYKITDPLTFAKTLNLSVSNAEARINTTVYNSIKNVVGNMSQEELISEKKGGLSSKIIDNMGNNLSNYGIQIVDVETKRLDLPETNKDAVYTRMISERNKIAATYTATGEKNSQLIKNQTDYDISVMKGEAKADAEQTIAEGEAEYMKILSDAYSDSDKAEFYQFVLSLDAAKESLKNGSDTLILSSDSPIAQIFNNSQ